jgi:hypothetical protein
VPLTARRRWRQASDLNFANLLLPSDARPALFFGASPPTHRTLQCRRSTSYCSDDNLVIVRGNQALAIAYAVHVLDLYDHYAFRGRLEQNSATNWPAARPLLFPTAKTAATQADSSSWMAFGKTRSAWAYFLQHTSQPVAWPPTLRHRRCVPAEVPRETLTPPLQPHRLPRARATVFPTGDLVPQACLDRNEQMPHPR